MMEAVVALAVLLHEFDFSLVPNQTIGMTTGEAHLTQYSRFPATLMLCL
jgi:hypothetical protein